MRIIILGATGYLGSRVVRKLIEQGHEILCLKRECSRTQDLEEAVLRGGIFATLRTWRRSLRSSEAMTAC